MHKRGPVVKDVRLCRIESNGFVVIGNGSVVVACARIGDAPVLEVVGVLPLVKDVDHFCIVVVVKLLGIFLPWLTRAEERARSLFENSFLIEKSSASSAMNFASASVKGRASFSACSAFAFASASAAAFALRSSSALIEASRCCSASAALRFASASAAAFA